MKTLIRAVIKRMICETWLTRFQRSGLNGERNSILLFRYFSIFSYDL